MSGLKINFKESKVSTFEPIPRGTYDCTVFEAKMGETKGAEGAALPGGTPKIDVQFKVNDDNEDYANRRLWRGYIIPPTEIDGEPYKNYQVMMDQLFTFYAAIGFSQDEMKKWKELPDMDELAGRECRVTVKINEYQGTQRNEVTAVKPAGSGDSVGGGLRNL